MSRYDRPVSDSPYRVPVPRPPDQYLVAWRDLRRRRTAALPSFLLCLPIYAITSGVVTGPATCLKLPLVAIIIAAFVHSYRFRCPRCARAFLLRPWSLDPRAHSRDSQRQCIHCGIAIGTPKNTSASDAP